MLEGRNVEPDAFRILVADDESDALEEYAIALKAADGADQGLTNLESELFGDVAATPPNLDAATYELELCRQGDEAIEAVRTALAAGRPFALAFLDVRMPPGPDGVETAERIRALDPDINIVFVTGYADLHPDRIAKRVKPIDKLLYCQKPVQATELQQFAHALCAKWQAERNLVTTAKDLLTTKERLQHLLTSSPAVIYSCAPGIDYAATFVSENIEAILGYSACEFVENPSFWLDHIHPEDIPNIRNKIEQVFRNQQVVTEYRFRHKDGQYRWLLDDARAVIDANGSPIELVGYCIDITDRKAQQAALQHQALHDALTGLPNRSLLADRLVHGLRMAQREQTSLALLLLDLD
ncbi:MAG: PAS domain-containing protein, partial [Geminicoccaceae bacterium]